MNYDNNTFENTDVELDGNEFHNCRFNNCTLVYANQE